MMASSVLNQCACSCTDAFRGPESADAFSDDEGPGGYGGGGQLSPGGKHFFDGHEHLAVVESASRVAIHAFFREHKPSKPSAEIDAMIERYERKRVSPRVLLHLVEGAFTRGRIKKRQSVIYQRRSVLAQRLRLEQGPGTGQQKGAKFPTSKAPFCEVDQALEGAGGREARVVEDLGPRGRAQELPVVRGRDGRGQEDDEEAPPHVLPGA